MRQNSAVFMKALVEQGIAYSVKNNLFESVYSFDFAFGGQAARANVALFNDDNGLRIIITDFFAFDKDDLDAVLDILNNACAERSCFTAYTSGGEVFLRKELLTGTHFSAEAVFATLDIIHVMAQGLLDKLWLIYSTLS